MGEQKIFRDFFLLRPFDTFLIILLHELASDVRISKKSRKVNILLYLPREVKLLHLPLTRENRKFSGMIKGCYWIKNGIITIYYLLTLFRVLQRRTGNFRESTFLRGFEKSREKVVFPKIFCSP